LKSLFNYVYVFERKWNVKQNLKISRESAIFKTVSKTYQRRPKYHRMKFIRNFQIYEFHLLHGLF